MQNHFYKVFEHSCVASVCDALCPISIDSPELEAVVHH